MCLALPVRVVDLLDDEQAVVDLGGIRKQVSLALVDGVRVGDYVILHVGYALTRLDPDEAEKTLALFREAGIQVPDPSPFKGEAGRAMGLVASDQNPSPPLPPPLEGEGKRTDARRCRA